MQLYLMDDTVTQTYCIIRPVRPALALQFCTASLLFCCAGYINSLYLAADVTTLTAIFFVFVLLAATQVCDAPAILDSFTTTYTMESTSYLCC
jgi:hypothetical protein